MGLTYNQLKRIIKNELKFLNETWEKEHVETLVNVVKAFNTLSKDKYDTNALKVLKLTIPFLLKNKYVEQADVDLYQQFMDTGDIEEFKHAVGPKLQDALFNLQTE